MYESPHSDCSMPDLSPHKAHTGIQICQAQQVRKLRFIMLGTYNQARAVLHPVPYIQLVGTTSKLLFLPWLSNTVTGAQTAL